MRGRTTLWCHCNVVIAAACRIAHQPPLGPGPTARGRLLCRFEDVSPEPYDLVVDTIGGDYELRSIKLVKKSGHFAHILNSGFLYQ